MTFSSEFTSLMTRINDGDQAAAEEFLRDYSWAVHRVIRRVLGESGLKRQMDAKDILQSVLTGFLVAARQKGHKWESANHVLAYMVEMAHNKISKHERHSRRETERSQDCSDASLQAMATDGIHPEIAQPGDAMEQRDEMDRVHDRMSEPEWKLARARAAGKSWEEIAAGSGEQKETIRKRFNRTLDRLRCYFQRGGNNRAGVGKCPASQTSARVEPIFGRSAAPQ